MRLNLDNYPTLKRIIQKVYKDEIVCKKIFDGALDLNWIKEFELFYNSQPKSVPYVKRVLFKKNEKRGKDAGFSNVRPITDASEVSETYLVPPSYLETENNADLKCLMDYDIYGEEVKCVPYIMPETIFGMCIHASIWICLTILENLGMIEESHCIPIIETLARGSPYADKQGLLFVQTARILRMCKTNSFYVINTERPTLTDDQMLMELYAYIESGLPVILGVDIKEVPWWASSKHGYHSIVAIGHTMDDNGKVDGFVFHDESVLPYQVMMTDKLLAVWHTVQKRSPRKQTREMVVAVPPEVSLPFYKVYPQFEQIMKISRDKGLTHDDSDDLLIKPVLKRPIDVVLEYRLSSLYNSLRETNAEKYVWVLYLYDKDTKIRNVKSSKGFFVRDATVESELRFLYFKETKQAIYQKKREQVYLVTEGRKRKRRLK